MTFAKTFSDFYCFMPDLFDSLQRGTVLFNDAKIPATKFKDICVYFMFQLDLPSSMV